MNHERATNPTETRGPAEAPRYSRIVVGTDGSACSTKAVRHAAELAGRLGAELLALYAVDVANAFHVGIHFGEAVAELERFGEKALRSAEEIASDQGIPPERFEKRLVRGRPHAAIIQAAEEVGASLVVVGSKGMTSVERALLGSESTKVVHYAKCPVLVVHDA
jgi:nucleotide-binding universal stress UspA family protein